YGLMAKMLASYIAANVADPASAAEETGRQWGRHLGPPSAPFTRTSEEQARRVIRLFAVEGVVGGASVPGQLSEVITLGRTLKRRAADVLAYFDRPGTSNGPTEAINGRLEHLRGTALGFRNLTNYIARS